MKNRYMSIQNYFKNRPLDFYDKTFILFLIPVFCIRIYLIGFTNLVQYPYHFPDSWSWLSDALHLAGYDTQMSYRPPVFTSFIAIYYMIGLENLIPYNGQIFSIMAIIGTYAIASKLYTKEIGLYSGILLLMNGYFLSYSTYIIADILGVALITFAFYFFIVGIRSDAHPMNLYLSGFIGGLSFITQYIGILVIFVASTFLIFQGKRLLSKRKDLIISSFIYILTSSSWFIYRWINFGDPFYSKVTHIGLLDFKLDLTTFLYYVLNTLSFTSFICIFLAVFGIVRLKQKYCVDICALKNKNGAQLSTIFILIWIIVFFSFFVFIYSWNDSRFILYWIIPLLILSSVGISYIRKEIQILKYKKMLFPIIFVVVILLANISFVSNQDTKYMIYPNSLTEINPDSFQIDFTYHILYQNHEKYMRNQYSFTGGYFANIDPYILPDLGGYIDSNSKKSDLVAVKPALNEGWYWYIFNNQLAVLTKRQTVPMDQINGDVKFIIFQRESPNDPLPEFENFQVVEKMWMNNVVYRRSLP